MMGQEIQIMGENIQTTGLALELQKCAREAVLAQSACNLSGVAHSFSRAMSVLCKIRPDTKWRNEHPIAYMFSVQIAYLANSSRTADQLAVYGSHLLWCERVAGSIEEATKEVLRGRGQ